MNNPQHFISSINSLREQFDFDKEYVQKLSSIFGTEFLPTYDNSRVSKSLVDSLSLMFTNTELAKEEINNYMFDLNFGRVNSKELITPEDLYSRILELSKK